MFLLRKMGFELLTSARYFAVLLHYGGFRRKTSDVKFTIEMIFKFE